MPRKAPKIDTLRALFARSGNRCAFPGCSATLVNEKNQFIAQVCHIEAAEHNGERYNHHQSDEERRAYENLILLCYPHHVETNDVVTYGVVELKTIKLTHENNFYQQPYKIDESLLYKVAAEMEKYWHLVGVMHANEHISPEISLPIDENASYSTLAISANELLMALRDVNKCLSASQSTLGADVVAFIEGLMPNAPAIDVYSLDFRVFALRDWESIFLAMPNLLNRLAAALEQMELRHLEAHLMLNPNDRAARDNLENLKQRFLHTATSAGLV